ncbi:hypothetical protein F5884DRAFT_509071 [Xylogone sp. PMI_703]|nr:hypothetical protein F5884DRAFT_509071 [Xylogone sp. PMI_703]
MEQQVERHKFCIVVGGGVGGLIQAAELLRKKVLRKEELQIFERDGDYGGVWKAATYPGAACDVFSCMYQISWHRNPDWKSLFPTGPELVQYYKQFAEHYGLPGCTLFKHSVERAIWSEDRSLWILDVKDVHTGIYTRWTSRVLVQAAGTYNRKVIPPIPGIDRFKGDTWHTVDWPEEYDFKGKSVAYVGTGPTSVQVLPHLQAQAKSVNVFCRSMTYCHPFINFSYPDWIRWAFRWIPGLLALYTFIIAFFFGIWAYFAFRPETWLARYTEQYCHRYLEKKISDSSLLRIIRPKGRFGAKRPLVSLSGFFEVLQKDNVSVIDGQVIAIDESGVITKAAATNDAIVQIDNETANTARTSLSSSNNETVHVRADVLIWGTGFKMQGWGGAVPTVGRDGRLLSEHWEDYPKTLYGTMTTSFPNLFLVNGPNTTTPWASLIKGLEYQAAHNLKIMRHIYNSSKVSPYYALEPLPERETEWTESMQSELDRLATSPRYGPAFYYLNKNDRNTFFWPWSQRYYWWKVRGFSLRDYNEIGGQVKEQNVVATNF